MTESRAKSTASAVPHPYWIDGINDPKDTSRLVKRVKLSDLMNYDPRASYRHRRLWDFHLGWAHKDYNWTSLASVRRIHAEMQARSPTGTALSIQNIASGDRDLVEWKYLFEEEKGIVTDYAEEGSPFADWYVTLDFQPEEPEDGRPFSRKFHVLTTGGDGPDLDAYNDAVRAVFGKGKPIAEWVGRYVGVDKSGYWHLPDYQPEPEPASPPRRLTIEEAEREAYESFCAENGI
ncbi:hypothetical protein M2189_007676 [Bradyrhizobium japonicum]|uniref:hypothetical protein n=1 Tax=Bradyrhizobium japonicum TaxID=375 RepID=UPI002166F38D|nr:hypothetical protein [Bradyrhizobium japonicum]MCS3502811.1 hypothetical protein [Bradyrhizobium japonicum]MCS3964473.1 hypothetical protein [Bradyrhizobium japonicum]MCS3996782.1 hypothetical protein [Bradyrhizobium japonicum]